MSHFYVYMYLDQNNVPFYIGKGNGNRYKVQSHLREDQAFLKNKINKVGNSNVKIHFLHKDISEEEAFRWERYWIKYIGRRDLKEGTLCNLTDGGEGQSGFIHSEESKQKMRKAHKGEKNSMYGKSHTEVAKQKMCTIHKGKTHSDETREKMSKSQKGRKHPEGTKQKMSKTKKGKTHSVETKRKISDATKGKRIGKKNPMYGKRHTPETRQKMRNAKEKNKNGKNGAA